MQDVPALPVLTDADAGLRETLALLQKRDVLITRRRALQTIGAAAVMASPLQALACLKPMALKVEPAPREPYPPAAPPKKEDKP